MTYIHIAVTPGSTIENFRAVAAKQNPPPDIDGLLARAAHADADGLHVVSVWESKAQMDRFAAEQLLPAFHALGLSDLRAHTRVTAFDADEFYLR